MSQYLPIVALLAVAVVFAAASLFVSKWLAPRRPTAAKSAPYECGIVPSQEPPRRFPVRFYLIAMIFIVFDVEIIFLYPYAVLYRSLGAFGLIEVVVFAVAVFASFVFLIANGALDWGPQKGLRADPSVDPNRTLESTIRRVGLVGRGEPGQEHAA